MRFEYKYLIDTSDFIKIKRDMLPFLRLNKAADERKNKDYTVRSIYFDTMLWKYYFEKVEGLKVRKKLRIRAYNEYTDSKDVYLEIKRKNESSTSKNRFKIKYTDISNFFNSTDSEEYLESINLINRDFQEAKKFLFHFIKDGLRPTALVTYEREPYSYKFDKGLRITFDKNLRYLPYAHINELFDDGNLRPVCPGKIIIEIKFVNSFPIWLREILSRYNLQRMALSKYTMCMDYEKYRCPVNKFKKIAIGNTLRSHLLKQMEKSHA